MFPCIFQLRKLLHLLKIRAGLKLIFQNNKPKLTGPSLANFLRVAERLFDTESSYRSPPPVTNIFVEGIHKMQKIIQETALNGTPSKFRWGVPSLAENVDEELEMEIV